ncbi:MAG: fatty acid desaturase family protein [Crocinitomicaceae bacterium]
MSISSIRFSKDHNQDFYKVLQQRVSSYFKTENISRHGNINMFIKTIVMLAMYIVPFSMLFVLENSILLTLMWVIMGFGMAGIGLSVMHDANHGSYSKNQFVNKLIGHVITIIGGLDVTWKIQHNVLHHTYTNVTGMDEDLDPGMLLRFTPHEKRRKFHKYQHIYGWFLYSFMTILWSTVKDFKSLKKYRDMDLLKTQNTNYAKALTALIIFKLAYFTVFLILPLQFSVASPLAVILNFALMHFICGFILAIIFQPAHVIPSSDYPMPNNSGNIEADWAVNQLYNTANFAPRARLFTWFVGGLNYQVEHHLFPNICHVHYKKISKIVSDTAKEFNLPYYSQKTFLKALQLHTKMLYNLGHYDNAPAIA